jgi:hypothetical protein
MLLEQMFTTFTKNMRHSRKTEMTATLFICSALCMVEKLCLS